MINKDRMCSKAEKYNISLSKSQLEQLDIYARLLVEWNEKMNLTGITEPEDIETKHFLDSLLAAQYCSNVDTIADVGTGAGFPGVVMKIYHPQAEITLIDSLEKRLHFLDTVASELGLGMNYIHGRAEDLGHVDGLRESFSVTTARAVAQMNVLAEYCLPLTAVGGRMIGMKGKAAGEEMFSANAAINLLGGKIEEEFTFSLPDDSVRQISIISKIVSSPEKYPRRTAVIKKKPL